MHVHEWPKFLTTRTTDNAAMITKISPGICTYFHNSVQEGEAEFKSAQTFLLLRFLLRLIGRPYNRQRS